MAAFGKGEETIWEWAWFRVTEESVGNGLTIVPRMLGFVTYGLLFTSTTDLTQFIMSLIHQCRLSPKWAYGLLAGFRFVPLFQSELSQMKAAHKIRGYKQKNSWKAFIRYAFAVVFARHPQIGKNRRCHGSERVYRYKRPHLLSNSGAFRKRLRIFCGSGISRAGDFAHFLRRFLQGRLAALFYKPGYRRAFCKMQTFRTLTEIY